MIFKFQLGKMATKLLHMIKTQHFSSSELHILKETIAKRIELLEEEMIQFNDPQDIPDEIQHFKEKMNERR